MKVFRKIAGFTMLICWQCSNICCGCCVKKKSISKDSITITGYIGVASVKDLPKRDINFNKLLKKIQEYIPFGVSDLGVHSKLFYIKKGGKIVKMILLFDEVVFKRIVGDGVRRVSIFCPGIYIFSPHIKYDENSESISVRAINEEKGIYVVSGISDNDSSMLDPILEGYEEYEEDEEGNRDDNNNGNNNE